MSILKNLKQMFNKNIECGSEIDDRIVFRHKKKHIYLNKNIIVNDKTACVLVYKHKVCDVILPGKYRINQESIPETYSRAKIEKRADKGQKVSKIKVDIYYVNLCEFKLFSFDSDKPFKSKSSELGRVIGYLEGLCSVKIIDAGALIKALIFETGKAKNKNINNDIGLWVGNKINKSIEKNKIPASMILTNQTYVESVVNKDMQDALDKLGIVVSNVQLKAINFPKKNQAKINKYMSEHKRTVNTPKANLSLGVKSLPNNNMNIDNRSNFVARTVNASQKMGAYKVCSKCGAKVVLDARFCGRCGNRV